ncbi:hypothetical protein RMONA_01230 [Rickettsia monacensis]|uniref:beta-lactamase n=1 Tax=Rickettsia monacensis TaxID=109232 RepID=A0A0B7J2R0_9RICK|nr:penicillin-binding transpeptidase domain-containing protein [Rickettsia monacensis]CDI28899.1 hypothetical protein RMONA_1080 [Rickettsia monacensis IrR/Munich]CEO16668.1 hypothetical protein RMONA_01230 [Rickettsia monacensis]
MKKIILHLTALISLTVPFITQADCFLVKENDKFIKREGNCESRYAPCSTFKIAISLMGYDYEFLIDETHPKLPFKEDDVIKVLGRESTDTNRHCKRYCLCGYYRVVIARKLRSN